MKDAQMRGEEHDSRRYKLKGNISHLYGVKIKGWGKIGKDLVVGRT